MLSELGLDLVTAGAGGLQDVGALLNMKGGILGTHDTRAVFIINAQCIIQVTNPVGGLAVVGPWVPYLSVSAGNDR
jgi:hypothetical protein